jgi:MFS transporter, MHS family, proline/betaine transporter
MPMTLAAGWLSDALGRKPVMLAGCVGLLVLSIPSLLLIQTGEVLPVFGGLLMLGVLLSCFTGVMPSALPALFPTSIRYGALAIGFNLSVSLFGGTTPLLAAWLTESTHNLMMPAYYLMGAAIVGIVSIAALRETARCPLPGSAPSVGTKAEAREVLRGAQGARAFDDAYAARAIRA